jgi:hypothetical protein
VAKWGTPKKNILKKNRQKLVVNFTNILQAAFSYEIIEIWFYVGKDSVLSAFYEGCKFLKRTKKL